LSIVAPGSGDGASEISHAFDSDNIPGVHRGFPHSVCRQFPATVLHDIIRRMAVLYDHEQHGIRSVPSSGTAPSSAYVNAPKNESMPPSTHAK
jgi:hypothetical protein